jgi:hypothetical protein
MKPVIAIFRLSVPESRNADSFIPKERYLFGISGAAVFTIIVSAHRFARAIASRFVDA